MRCAVQNSKLWVYIIGSVSVFFCRCDYSPDCAVRFTGARDPAGGTEWFPTEPFYHRYDVYDSSVARAGTEETNSAVCMLHRPCQSVRLRWSNPPLDSTRPFWRATEHDLGHSSNPRWHSSMLAARRQGVLEVVCCGTRSSSRVRARAPPVQHLLRGGNIRSLHSFQGGLRYNGRFGTPKEEKGGGGKQLPESQSWPRRFGACVTLTLPGSSRSPEQLRKMMEVIVVVCAAFGLTVSEAKTEIMCLREGDDGVHRHIQRRGSGPGVQPDKRVYIPRGKR